MLYALSNMVSILTPTEKLYLLDFTDISIGGRHGFEPFVGSLQCLFYQFVGEGWVTQPGRGDLLRI
jgi:hypothetical protein